MGSVGFKLRNESLLEECHMKYRFPKFEMIRVKIDDFRSLQSCAILPSKIVEEMGPS